MQTCFEVHVAITWFCFIQSERMEKEKRIRNWEKIYSKVMVSTDRRRVEHELKGAVAEILVGWGATAPVSEI